MNPRAQKTFFFFLAIGLMAMLPGAAQAQTCGSVLTSNTTLTGDLVCPSGNGLELAASNISLDCAGFTISGVGAGVGILLDNVSQATVLNCTVDQFAVGFQINGGSDNRLFKNTATNNISASGGFNIVNGSTGNSLEGNISAFNPSGRGFSINGSDQNRLIYNRAFDNGFRGFDVINSNFTFLYANAAVENSSAGIVVQDFGGTSTGNVLVNNFIDSSSSEGLAMFASGNTVQALRSNNNGTVGINDTSGAANTYIANSCTGNVAGASSPPGLC